VSNGAVIWEGRSLLNGKPIVCIVTGLTQPSANEKTGDMLQTWILLRDVHPGQAVQTGADRAVCGSCPHAGGNSCYVQVWRAPAGIWSAYKAGSYLKQDASVVAQKAAGRAIRLGAYGDPAAVPSHVWQALLSHTDRWTGYTHQWRKRPDLAKWLMASVDSDAERADAQSRGWRTFRVMPARGWTVGRSEVMCPASEEAGKLTVCADCRLCSGTASQGKSVAIPAHGSKRFGLAVA